MNRVEQVGQMSRGLKLLARDFKVPVIALSQLSRAPEQRTGRDKRPILSDLRESGNLEQDADMVAFIYREDYYKNFDTEDESEERRQERLDAEGKAELIVRKNRNGPTDTVELAFHKEYATFMTLSTRIAQPASQATRLPSSVPPTSERAGRKASPDLSTRQVRRRGLDRG